MSPEKRTWLVLVVDDTRIVREPISACLRSAGYETLEAADGAGALGLISTRKPDLMILDLHMTGMDGLTLLSLARKRPEMADVPVIMLTAEAGRQFILRASELGVKQYMLKARFSLADLLSRVQKSLQPPVAEIEEPVVTSAAVTPAVQSPSQSIQPISTREKIIVRAEKMLEGKTLSGAAAQVITMAAAPSSSVSDLGDLIARDPILSANVLRVANSAAYASAKSVISTIPDAIRQVGCAAVGRIAAAIAVIDSIPHGPAGGSNPIRTWQHSFAVARICQQLTTDGDAVGGVNYLAGLCHDLADVLFQSEFPDECCQIAEAQARTGMRQSDVEKQLIGIRRAELVSIVLDKMGLPGSIKTPIVAFHKSMSSEKVSRNPLARLLTLAELYANGLLLAQSPDSLVAPLTKSACNEAAGMTDPPCPDSETLCAEVFTLTAMLARLSPREDARMTAPLLTRTNCKVWLARDRAFSAFDPLECALRSMAEVSLNDRLPDAAEALECDAIVVTTHQAIGCEGLAEPEIGKAPRTRAGIPPLWLKPDSDLAVRFRLPVSLSDLYRFIESTRSTSAKAAA